MDQRHRRSSRIIDIALTSAGIRPSPKCRQKLNFDDKAVLQPAPAPDRGDGILVEDFGQEPMNYSTAIQQDKGGVVPLASVEQNVGQPDSFIPSPSKDYILLQNSSVNAKAGKEVTDVVNTVNEANQEGLDLSLVDHGRENLYTDFINLDPTPIDQLSTSTGLVSEHKSRDYEPSPSKIPITDKCNDSTQRSNSMDPDTPNFNKSSIVTALIEIQSNEQNVPQTKKNTRKCKVNIKYIDYMSDQEDFSTFYGHIDDSDDWSKGQRVSDEECDDLDTTENTEKKKKRFRRRQTKTLESGDQDETVGDAGMRVEKTNKRNERSQKKKAGDAYTTKKGVTVPAKKILPNPCQGKRCGNDCGSIPEERRESIFNHFWKLDSVRRRDWLVSLSQRHGVKRKRSESEKRNYTIKYYINEGEGKRNVCLQFLAATINVSDRTIYSIVKNAECGSAKEDLRGKSEPSNKTKQTTIDAVIDFIKSLPAVPSHYGRQDSSKVYLPEKFKNIPNVFKIYRNHFVERGVDVVSERIFRKIFDETFNIGFHVPKKDKCKKCITFENTNDPDKLIEKQEHEKEKEESYARFKSHKKIHKEDR